MIDGVGEVVGKTITGVIVKAGNAPMMQVFLLFSDNTYYEFYSNGGRIEGVSQVFEGNADFVRDDSAPFQKVILEALPSSH